ncbi:MAG: hypothetical protein WD826_08160 [Actinomycetota bacterium]
MKRLIVGFRKREHLWPVVVLAIVLPFIVFVYVPAFMYGSNQALYQFPLRQTLPLLAIPFAVASFALFLPGLFAPPGARRFYAGLLAALTVYGWAHGFLLVRDYGLLDGGIDLPAFSALPLIVGGVLVLVVAFALSRLGPTRVMAVFIAVTLVLVGHVAFNIATDDKPSNVIDPAVFDSLTTYGDRNLVVVLLDALQSDVFAEAIERDPELEDVLDGFTHYPNTLGVGPTTFGSMPTIHTGVTRPAGRSMAEFFEEAIVEDSFENELADNGWEVIHANPVASRCPARIRACVGYLDTRERSVRGPLMRQAAYMVDLSFFRLAPPELKEAVYNNEEWHLRRAFAGVSAQVGSDVAFAEFARSARKGDVEEVAKVLHFQATHKPATRDADCVLLDEPISPMTWESAVDLATCALKRVRTLVSTLKDAGVYDNTSIVLLADHGYRDIGSSRYEGDDEDWDERIALANPLLAVKPPDSHGSLEIDPAELSLADVRTIVCSITDGCRATTDDWSDPPDDRVRLFTDYHWADQYWDAATLKDERHYEVRGPLEYPESWTDLGPTVVPEADVLTFGASDNVAHFGYGWGTPDDADGSRWGLGTVASLNVRLGDDRVRLTFDVGTLPELTGQTLTVKVNGVEVGTESVEGSRDVVTFTVSPDVKRRKVDQIVLKFAEYRAVDGNLPRHERRREALAIRFDELRISRG